MTKPQKLKGTSLNPQEELLALLRAQFPEVFSDGKVDAKKIKATLGEAVDVNGERYGLSWAGKNDCFRHIQEPTTATLKPMHGESVDFETTKNIFIEGDNLQVLKVLQKSYYGKVKMIYIDPPYNTGSDSFIYPDRFQESKEEYMERIGQKEEGHLTREGMWQKNSKDNGHYHSNWLSMMYPRLFLARNLLRQDGVIFVSIDDGETANLKLLLDEVFGEQNFIDTIAVEMSTTSGPKTVNAQQGTIVKNVEFVHIYSKSGEFDRTPHTPLLDGIDSYDTHYSIWMNDDGSLGNLAEKMANDKTVGQEIIRYGFLEREKFSVKNMDKLLSVSEAAKLFISANLDKIARIDRAPVVAQGRSTQVGRWERFEADHRTYILTTLESGALQALMPLSLNYRMSDDYKPRFGRTVIRGDLWKGFHQDMGNVAKEGDTEFSNGKKPVRLIKQLMRWASTTHDGIVLDFFAGSGTTAHAVMALNAEVDSTLQCISVQLDEPCDEASEAKKTGFHTIADIARERIRRAGKKIKKETGKKIDYGFKAFRLEESNFKIWRNDVGDADALAKQMEMFIDNVKKDSTQENILCELMLKTGLDLNTPTEKVEHKAGTYFKLSGGKLIVCIQEGITEALADKVLAEKPEKFICLDKAFGGNDQLKTNVLLQMEQAGVDFSVI